MIERLHRIATLLSRFRALLLLLAGGCLSLVVLSLIENPWLESETWLMPAIAAFLWLLLLYSLSFLFLNIPVPDEPGLSWDQRLSRRLRRGGLWVLGVMFLALSAAVLLLSYQLIRVSLL